MQKYKVGVSIIYSRCIYQILSNVAILKFWVKTDKFNAFNIKSDALH